MPQPLTVTKFEPLDDTPLTILKAEPLSEPRLPGPTVEQMRAFRPSPPPVEQPREPLTALSKAKTIQAEPEQPSFLGQLTQWGRDLGTDLAISVAKGSISTGQAVVGGLDVVTGGRAGKAVEDYGFISPKSVHAALDTYISEQTKKANLSVREAKGAVDKAVTALKNPRVIATAVAESGPLMLGGAGLARTLMTRGVPALAAAAIGEGAVTTGSQAEAIRQESETGLLTPGQSTIAVTSGAVTSLFGVLGATLARALDVADVDTLLAGALRSPTARQNLVTAVKQIATSAGIEGLVEEFPQSAQERISQNLAAGKPWDEGVTDEAVLGALAGAVMGGGGQLAATVQSTEGAEVPRPQAPPAARSVDAPLQIVDYQAPAAPQPPAPAPLATSLAAAPAPESAGDHQFTIATAAPLAEPVDVSPPKAERDTHTVSSTQVNLPEEPAAAVVAMANRIPDADLAADGRAGDSEATAPHVTVKYGIKTTDVDKVRAVLEGEPPITVTLGATSLFENEDADVLKADVDSPDLHRLNKKIADALETTDTHPTYVPHVTVAYLKRGKGQTYAGDESLKGQTFTLNSVRFSTKDGKIFEIPLTGQPEAAQTLGRGNRADTRPRPGDDRGQRQAPDADRYVEGTGEGTGPERRRLPAPHEYPLEAFRRAKREDDLARLTPKVTRELERIAEELREFPYQPNTWEWLGPEDRKTGNAAGGDANIVAGGAGAAVYNDILQFAPLNKGATEDFAKTVSGSRADVEKAIRKAIDGRIIHSNIAEGAVRVAERRAADDFRHINRPLLPPSWGEELPAELEAQIDEALSEVSEADLANADVSFDTNEFGEEQPRLPEAGAVREQNVATPQIDAPFSLPREADTSTKGTQENLLDTLQKAEDAARERLKGKLGQITAGLDPTIASDLVIIGAAKIAKGTVQFAQWSTEMVKEFGDKIKPHLRALFEQATIKAKGFGPLPVHAETGRELPPQQPIRDDRLHEFPSIQKMPRPIRADIEGMLQRYAGFESQRRGVQSWERTQELSKDVWLPLETLTPGRALNAEELHAYQTAIATALTMRKPLLEKISAGEASEWDRLQASHLTDVATVLTASYRGAKAEAGRALNILRVKARVLDLRESRFLEAALRAPGFQQDVTRIAKEALDVAGDPLAQLKLLRRRSGTWFDYAQAVYYANLLSGVKTHERNLIGNSFNVLANTVTPVGAVAADVVRAARTGQPRTTFLREMPHAMIGGFVGLDRGIQNAAFTFRHGFRPSTVESAAAGKFDAPRVELPGGLANPFNIPSRALEAADEFFRSVAYHQELYASIYSQARSEGLTEPTAIRTRMAALLAATDPSTRDGQLAEHLIERASTFAARAVFQEDPGPIVNWLLKAKAPHAPLALKVPATFIVPFIRTPGAIMRQGFEWTPAGFVMRGSTEGQGRAQAQAQGRALLGSALLLPIAWLAATGRLTGAPPDDPGEREEFFAQGKLANAVRIGDYWVRYVLFQPFSVPMAAVASAWETFRASRQDDTAAQDAFTAALAGAGQSLFDQSFLSGLGTLMDAIHDPQRYAGRWLNMFVQGFVPLSGLMRNVTQAIDPVYRRPQGVAESVRAITPGASTQLTPRRTRFGTPVTAPGGPLQRGFLVPEVSKAIEDTTTQTLARIGYTPLVPKADLTLRGEKVPLSREQEDVLIEALGRERKFMIEAAIQHERFASRPDEVNREVLENAAAAASRAVRARALRALQRKDTFTLDRLVSPRVMDALERDRQAFAGREDARAVAR